MNYAKQYYDNHPICERCGERYYYNPERPEYSDEEKHIKCYPTYRWLKANNHFQRESEQVLQGRKLKLKQRWKTRRNSIE